jgi:RNA polymerase sigma-70 factor (ECF subfamily)
LTDAELLSRILEGDEGAFTGLIERHHGSLVRLAASIVGDRGTAEEVAQETWLAVLDGVRSFEARSSLKTWIFRILVNRARTRRARESRSSSFSSLESDGEDAPAVDPSRFDSTGHWSQPPRRWDDDTPDRVLQRAEALAQLEAALATLPANQRAVVTLRDIEGCGSQEVCALLEITEVNQRVLLHRARARLRAALERYVERG